MQRPEKCNKVSRKNSINRCQSWDDSDAVFLSMFYEVNVNVKVNVKTEIVMRKKLKKIIGSFRTSKCQK